jgi:hypothetical protein
VKLVAKIEIFFELTKYLTKKLKFMEIVQVILSSCIAMLVGWMLAGSVILSGSWCWYHWIVSAMLALTIMLVAIAIKEYKQSIK